MENETPMTAVGVWWLLRSLAASSRCQIMSIAVKAAAA